MEIIDKLQKLLDNVHREMEILIIDQKEMLEIKKNISEIKNSQQTGNNQERTSELEPGTVEIIQNET